MPLIQNFQDNLSLQYEARANDLIRIAKAINPLSVSGAKFSAHQALLLGSTGDLNLRQIGASTASIIASILAQVPVAGTGTHFLNNELLRAERATYLANKNAASEARQNGAILIKKTSRMRGAKTLENDYGFGGAGTGDKINEKGYLVDFGYDDKGFLTTVQDFEEIIGKDEDLVPFYVKILRNPGLTATPYNIIFLRSFLTSISDSYNGNWTTTNFVGRGEPFYVYTGHTRKINMSLKLAAFSKPEMAKMYEKLNALISTTAPEYTTNGYMKGVVVKMTLGNYIKDLIGHVDNVNVNIVTDYQWETEDRTLILPTVLDVTLTFTPTPGQAPQAAIEGITSTYVNQQ